jgi:hypothetical protein
LNVDPAFGLAVAADNLDGADLGVSPRRNSTPAIAGIADAAARLRVRGLARDHGVDELAATGDFNAHLVARFEEFPARHADTGRRAG